MKPLMKSCILMGLVLGFCLGGAAGLSECGSSMELCEGGYEDSVSDNSSGSKSVIILLPKFGTKVMSGDPDENRLLDDFEVVPATGRLRQLPVSISWWDIGPNQLLFDEEDVLYLHIGETSSVGTNDIRLTPFGLHPAGSKVNASDPDMGQALAFEFGSPYLPEIVYADVGGVVGQYDLEDVVYIKTALPFVPAQSGVGELATGDVRLTRALEFLPGSRVRDFDPDNGAFVRILHGPVTTFDVWGIFDRGAVRFYNTNGNVYMGPLAQVALL